MSATLVLFLAALTLIQPQRAQAEQRRMQLEKPEYWNLDRGNRIHEELPYLADPDPETRILIPLKSRVRNRVLHVGDDQRGDLLRLERVKDYVLVELLTFRDPGLRGRVKVGGPHFSSKGVALFFGAQRAHGAYKLYDEIRVFGDPERDLFPIAVIRFRTPGEGAVYLDPMASGEPAAIVNFKSAPEKP